MEAALLIEGLTPLQSVPVYQLVPGAFPSADAVSDMRNTLWQHWLDVLQEGRVDVGTARAECDSIRLEWQRRVDATNLQLHNAVQSEQFVLAQQLFNLNLLHVIPTSIGSAGS